MQFNPTGNSTRLRTQTQELTGDAIEAGEEVVSVGARHARVINRTLQQSRHPKARDFRTMHRIAPCRVSWVCTCCLAFAVEEARKCVTDRRLKEQGRKVAMRRVAVLAAKLLKPKVRANERGRVWGGREEKRVGPTRSTRRFFFLASIPRFE
eukprot:3322065-Rhodomonas_salina.1